MAQLRSSFADVNCNLVPLIASIWLRVQLFSQSTYICLPTGIGQSFTKPILWNHTIWDITPLYTLTCFLTTTWHHISAVLNLLLVLSLLGPMCGHETWHIHLYPTKMKMVILNMWCIYLASHKRLIFNNCVRPKFTELSMQAMAISSQLHTGSTLTAR
jgi:hypothetical protein